MFFPKPPDCDKSTPEFKESIEYLIIFDHIYLNTCLYMYA